MKITTKNWELVRQITTPMERWTCLGVAVDVYSGSSCSEIFQNLSVTAP